MFFLLPLVLIFFRTKTVRFITSWSPVVDGAPPLLRWLYICVILFRAFFCSGLRSTSPLNIIVMFHLFVTIRPAEPRCTAEEFQSKRMFSFFHMTNHSHRRLPVLLLHFLRCSRTAGQRVRSGYTRLAILEKGGGCEEGEGLRGARGPRHHFLTPHPRLFFFPFLNLSSPTPTRLDSCDTTRGNRSHFTAVTKGFLAHPAASLPSSPKPQKTNVTPTHEKL